MVADYAAIRAKKNGQFRTVNSANWRNLTITLIELNERDKKNPYVRDFRRRGEWISSECAKDIKFSSSNNNQTPR